jgi:hypothetical protein
VGALDPAVATAATLLAHGTQDRDQAPAVMELAALVEARVAGHAQLGGALQQAHERSEDPEAVALLAAVLADLGRLEPAFQRELIALVDRARQAPRLGELVTRVYGHARVGKLVTIGQAGQVHVHLPAEPPPSVLERLPATRPGPVVINLPARNRLFTGRVELLEGLYGALHNPAPHVGRAGRRGGPDAGAGLTWAGWGG